MFGIAMALNCSRFVLPSLSKHNRAAAISTKRRVLHLLKDYHYSITKLQYFSLRIIHAPLQKIKEKKEFIAIVQFVAISINCQAHNLLQASLILGDDIYLVNFNVTVGSI